MSIEARDALTDLAAGLGFIVTRPGTYYGKASPPAMMDALAAAYRLDPVQTRRVLRSILEAKGVMPNAARPAGATPPTE